MKRIPPVIFNKENINKITRKHKSSHHQLGAEKPAQQKRLIVEIPAGGGTIKGKRTAKRRELTAVPREQAAKPHGLEVPIEIPSDGCSACGFRAEHLFQLTDMA